MPIATSMKITHPIPSGVPTSLMVYCRLDPRRLPTPQEIVTLSEGWIAANVRPPLNSLMPPWLRLPMTKMGPVPVDGLPQLVTSRHRSNLMDPAHEAMMDQANYVIMIRSEGPCIPGMPGMLPCVAAAFACQEQFGGLVIDVDTNSPILPRPFDDLVIDMVPRIHCFVDVSAVDGAAGGTDIVTAGMARFGLPELVMEDVPLSIDEQCAKVVLGVGQMVMTMGLQYGRDSLSPQFSLQFPMELSLTTEYMQTANGDPIGAPSAGAGSNAPVRVEFSQQSPSRPAMLKVVPAEGWPSSKAAWANGLVSTFFAPLPSTAEPRVHDDKMEAAHRRAVDELADAKRRYLAGETLPDMFIVKYPFPLGDGHHEYMWISVRGWTGDRITGVLGNQPAHRTDLSMGDTVTIDAADVFDWMIVGPDGVLGGYTDATRGMHANQAPPSDGPKPTEFDPDVPEFVRRRRDPRFLDRVTRAGRAKAMEMVNGFEREASRRVTAFRTPAIIIVVSVVLSHWAIWLGIGVLFGLYKLREVFETRKRLQGIVTGFRDVASRGEFRIGMPIMFNTTLKEPGNAGAPVLLLMMPNDAHDPIQLFDSIMMAAMQKDPRFAAVNKAMDDQTYTPNHRFRIPKEWTGGADVYGVGVLAMRDHWRSGIIDEPCFALLAGPGDTGGVMTLPWTLVDDALRA